jgi:hypothetical protein
VLHLNPALVTRAALPPAAGNNEVMTVFSAADYRESGGCCAQVAWLLLVPLVLARAGPPQLAMQPRCHAQRQPSHPVMWAHLILTAPLLHNMQATLARCWSLQRPWTLSLSPLSRLGRKAQARWRRKHTASSRSSLAARCRSLGHPCKGWACRCPLQPRAAHHSHRLRGPMRRRLSLDLRMLNASHQRIR